DNDRPRDPNRPPRDNDRPRDPNRPPRDNDRPRDPNRPPRDNDRPRDPNRPPRDNDRPRDPNRPPRDNDRPRDPNRPPRDPNSPQRDPNRPVRDDRPRDPNRPPRDPNRPPRDPNRPPRDPNRPPRDNDRPRDPNRPPRDPNRPIRDAVKPGEATTDSRYDRKDRKPRIHREIDINETPIISAVSSDRYLKVVEKPELAGDKKYKPKIKTKAIDIEEETKKNALKDKDKKRKKKKKSIREQITKEDVDRAVRETMLDMDTSFSTGNRSKLRQKRKEEKGEKIQREFEESQKEDAILKLTEFVTTSDMAGLMNITPSEIILKCMELGLMVSINQRLDKDTIILIADDYGYEIEFVDEKQLQFIEVDEDDEEDLQPRSPIVTIMGHVDHGKTSLLDHIREANVVAGEAGGITQHIGAYTVKTAAGKAITFLDTPGHEAFTAMRARGAQATDLVVLVVAADDSVMPQTIEAISHSKAANVPIVVAINKIDKPDANPDRIRQQLTDHGILVEEWGGKYQCAEISAKKGINIEGLLEKILIESEMLDLKANPDRLARGVVIESQMSKGFGPVSTVIVQKGTLRVGDAFVSGVFSGRVRAMLDDKGVKIETAGPSQPVLVIGYDGLPEAGDGFMAMKDDADVRKIASERKQLKREQEFRQVHHITLDEISAQIQIGGVKDLNLVIKADVAGSLEALSDSLQKLSTEEVRVNILHKGVGPISETDVMLAAASQAVVIAFNINPTTNARRAAEKEFVDIRRYDIIYDCINEVQLALEGLLAPELVEKITGTVEVRQTFKISRTGTIAGCMVLTGKITRNDKVRLLRDGFKVYEGTINSLKREKDDAREVLTNYECGIMLNNFNDLKPGDIVEAYTLVEKKRYLNS
ncbi:MAG: translation initiation factor IF-2, partial [bacterium]